MQIRDALHGDIKIENEMIVDVINTKEFQRLRKIKQLGLTFTVFPSSEHTRFSHSIGVYHNGQMVMDALIKKGYEISDFDRESFYLACLLHDVGHGPLSHTAETLFNYSHEDYSRQIIIDEGTEINQVLKKYNPNFVQSTCKIIEKTYENEVLNKLLSSSVDVDRMDYLPRDSIFTGVVYGNIEVERLVDQMYVIDGKLCFDIRAVHMIEDFLISRYQMFSQVYLNSKSMVYETLVQKILIRVEELSNTEYQFKTNIEKLLPFIKRDFSVKEYLIMNDVVMNYLLEEFIYEDDQILSDMANAFSKTSPIESEVSDYSKYIEIKTPTAVKQKIYNDIIYLFDKEGKIYKLEDISQLMSFAKNDLKITLEESTYYVRK